MLKNKNLVMDATIMKMILNLLNIMVFGKMIFKKVLDLCFILMALNIMVNG